MRHVCLLEGHDILQLQLLDGLIGRLIEILLQSQALHHDITTDDTILADTRGGHELQHTLFRDLKGSLALRDGVKDLIKLVDAVHHLIVLRDDMGEEILLFTLTIRTEINGTGIIRQTTGLTHLLEHDTVHTRTEILVEELLNRILIRVPRAIFIMVHAHVDVLCIIRSNPYLVLRGELTGVRLTCGNRFEYLRCGMHVCQQRREFLSAHRTVIEYAMRHIAELLQQIQEILGIRLAQLLLRHIVTTHVMRAIEGVVIQVVETGTLVLFTVLTGLQDHIHEAIVRVLTALGVLQEIFQQLQGCRHVLTQT